MKILIVARADALRNGLQTLLGAVASTAEIDVADNPALATILLRQKAYRLVFFYPGLPFPSLLAAAIRARQAFPETCLVMVIEDQAQAAQALAAGVQRVLLKGFNLEQLADIFDGLTSLEPRAAFI